MLRWTPHLLKKSRMFVNTDNLEGGANNSELDKDTDRRNLDSKVEYLSLALPLNILFLLLVFIGFNTCKVRCGFSYTITIIIVQAIVNVGLLSAWSCMFFVEHMMNTLDDCDLQEKVPIWLMHMNIMILQCQKKYNNSDFVVQSLYIIIVLVLCENAMAINVTRRAIWRVIWYGVCDQKWRPYRVSDARRLVTKLTTE